MISQSITLQDFKQTYYYKEDLISFCKEKKIPYIGLMKIDLEANIIAFLTGKKAFVKPRYGAKNWVQDNLALDAEVTLNYRSNQATRQFFESVIGKKFRFCGALMKFKENNPERYVTYQDLVDIWYEEARLKKNGTPSTEKFYKANRYNKFVKKFFADPKNKGKGRKEMLVAWEECKKSGKVNDL